MDTKRLIDPVEALDKLFGIVREEATSNPRFGRRLLEAIGYRVIFRGEDAVEAVDPVLVAMHGLEEFRKTFLSMTAAEVKKVGEAHGLIQKPPKGGKKTKQTHSELVDLLWNRARQRLADLFPQARDAAE